MPDELTPREAEVLAAVERRLSNPEIAEELYVSVRTVESHVAALRRKLGADSRAKLVAAARARRGTVVQLPQNSFVGRDADLRLVRSLLADHRLVTVVGPAGCGKTRLALEVAAADDPAPVVADLSHAGSGRDAAVDEVATSLARALSMGADASADLVAACGLALAARPYLLVVDNCDRVTAAVADAVGRLLALAPGLVVLATSRSPLGGPGEAVAPLSPLSEEGAAARLFLDRARTAAPTRPVAPEDLALVERMCARLDGLPLAIELAAARARHLPVAELADRLDADLGLLGAGAGDGAPDGPGAEARHATLDAALAWTWDLLDDDERSTLARLAALPRDVDLEVAEAVTGPGAGRTVLRLLDRSLLAQTPTVSDPRRFRLLHPVREFTLGRTDAATVEAARRAHAEHHAELIGALAARARTEDGRALVTAARRVMPDAAAALRWAVRDSGTPSLAVRLARALGVVAEHCGPGVDALDALALAARTPAVVDAASTEDLLAIGQALCYGDLDLVGPLASAALAKSEAGPGPAPAAVRLPALQLAGLIAAYRHDAMAAVAHLGEAARLADEVVEAGGASPRGAIEQARGIALRNHGNAPGAMLAFEAALAGYAEAGDAMHVNNTRYMMAATAAATGHRAREAIEWAAASIAYATATGNDHELAHATLAAATLRPGDDTPDVLRTAAATFRAAGDLRCLTRTYLQLARHQPPDERRATLAQALAVATSAHDDRLRATALERLVDAHWQAGDRHAAYVALGSLTALVGEDAALAHAPDAARADAPAWRTALAEGRARATRPPNVV